MEISYPNYTVWQRETSKNPLDFVQGKTKKKLESTIKKLTEAGIDTLIEPLERSFFEWFTPLYNSHIASKQNNIVHDIYAKTLGKETIDFPYFSLTLFERGEKIGGTIFSSRPDRIAYAFRIFPSDWQHANLLASPALVGEYAIETYAIEHQIPHVSHGRDRNPFGINAAIGLATFKLSMGCQPVLPTVYEAHTLDSDTVDVDTLVLTLPTQGEAITKAFLVTTPENEARHVQVTKYPHLLSVETLYRKS